MPRLLGNPFVLCLALLCLVFAIYRPGLSGPFIFDDYPNIVSNPLVQAESLDWKSIKRAARGYAPGAIGRPVATVGFAIDYAIGGKDPWGYKLHSLVVHLLNAALVFAFVRMLLAAVPQPWVRRNLAAAGIALLWAAHPLQVSTVLYVVQRMEMLSLTFVLLALAAYLHGRRRQIAGLRGWPWLLACVPLVALGALSKETAVLFPLYTLALELTLLRFGATDAGTRRLLRWGYAAGVAIGVLVYLFVVLPMYLPAEAYSYREFTMGERLLTQLRVLPIHLGQMFLPIPGRMVFYYDHLELSRSLFEPITTLAGGLLLLAMLALAAWCRKRAPLVALGILWFFAAHAITSNVIPLEIAFEHRNYFALLGILLAVADLIRRIPVQDTQTGKGIMVACVIAMFAFFGYLRVGSWGNELLLASDLVRINPGSPRASNDLATLYIGMSDGFPNSPFFAWGMKEFERASKLPNSSPLPEQGLILSAASTGQPVKDEWWDRMITKINSRAIGPQESLAVVGITRQRARGVELDDRRLADVYSALEARSRQRASTYALFGDHAITRLKDEALAEHMFLKAIDASADNPAYATQIVQTLLSQGHASLAKAALERAASHGIRITQSAPDD